MNTGEILSLLKKGIPENAAIPFSGGLDSSVLLALSKGAAITVGFPDSEDVRYAKRAFAFLSKGKHIVHFLDGREVKEALAACKKLAPDFVKTEVLVPIWAVCKAAKENGFSRLAFGCGAEEIFIGYEKFFECYEKVGEMEFLKMQRTEIEAVKIGDCRLVEEVCGQFGLEASFPYLNSRLIDDVLSIPLEERLGSRRFKKLLLRHIARGLVPNFVLFRAKKAVQYGSGVHKVIVGLESRGSCCEFREL